MPKRPSCLLAIVFLMPSVSAQVSITYGTSTQLQKIIVHDGTELIPAGFIVELGAFQSGFTPTTANVADWEAHWKTFDAVTNPDSDTADFFIDGAGDTARFGGNAGQTTSFTSTSEDASGGSMVSPLPPTFTPLDQAYVWVYNKTTVEADTEWALYTNLAGAGPTPAAAWKFPSGSPLEFPRSWFISAADTAVIGAIHGGSGAGFLGSGSYTDNSGDFILRTHRLIPMPEPGTVFLSIVGILAALRRQRF